MSGGAMVNRCDSCGKMAAWITLTYGTKTIGGADGMPEDIWWCEHLDGFGCKSPAANTQPPENGGEDG